ncbi:MAG: hypothetical protein AAF467_10320 [Actinomycetota bacterium]
MILDDDSDVHDPDLAARFSALDSLTPPDLTAIVAASAPVGPHPASGLAGRFRTSRPWLIGGMAAVALLVVAGVAAVVVNQTNDQTVAAAPEGAASPTVDPVESDADETDEADRAESAESAAAGTSIEPDETDDAAPGTVSLPEQSATTTTTEQAGNAGADSSGTDAEETTVPTPSLPPPESTTTIDPLETTTSFRQIFPGPDVETVTVAGLVTEVFHDCVSWLRLRDDDSGEITPAGALMCDGGSWVVIDGVRIRTSSGFVPLDLFYDKHPAELLPGMSAAAIAVDEGALGLTLRCNDCSIATIKPSHSPDG